MLFDNLLKRKIRMIESHALLAESWIVAIEECGELAGIIEQAKRPESREALQLFLGRVLERAKEWANPFYGDVYLHGYRLPPPEGASDVVDDELDLDPINIHHLFDGGLHCFLVELVTYFCSSHTEDESLPWIKGYVDYFIGRRGCTTCAQRILALFLIENVRQAFIDERTQQWIQGCHPFSSRSSTFHAEMTLWLLTLSSLSTQEQMNYLRTIHDAHGNDFIYLMIYTKLHRVYKLLDWFYETSVGTGNARKLRYLREQRLRERFELRRRVEQCEPQREPQRDSEPSHFDIEQWEEWFVQEQEWLSEQTDSVVQDNQ